jgi:outer membrane protein OmpA-like peptidoglycan-associated protein
MATRKFVRNEVGASSETLNARIDTTDGEVSEVRDNVDRVDGRVTELDSKTAEGMTAIRGEVQTVDQKALKAQSSADQAAAEAGKASTQIVMLDEKFQNRNQFVIAEDRAVYFSFDSSRLDPEYTAMLDEIAEIVTQNANALIVLEGRTDSIGNADYNIRLGERRVEAVKRYLAVDKGVPVYRIHEISLGAARPVASNDSREGREKNRAVTISVLVPSTSVTTSKNNQ